MDNHRKIYEVSIDNEEPNLATTAVELLWDKQNALDPPL